MANSKQTIIKCEKTKYTVFHTKQEENKCTNNKNK